MQPKVVFQKLNYVLEILKFHIQRQIPYLKSPFFKLVYKGLKSVKAEKSLQNVNYSCKNIFFLTSKESFLINVPNMQRKFLINVPEPNKFVCCSR